MRRTTKIMLAAARSVLRAPASVRCSRAFSVRAGDAEALERIIAARHSCRKFDSSQIIGDDVLLRLARMTIRTPTSWNINPYTVIFVRDAAVKRRLADAMISNSNSERVADASVTAVFAADMEPARLLPETVRLERDAGRPARYCRGLETEAGAALAGPLVDFPEPSAAGMAHGASLPGALGERDRGVNPLSAALHAGAQDVKRGFTGIASMLLGGAAPVPTLNSAEGWGFKQAGLAASTYVLAATSLGLATAAMEGMDGRLVAEAVRLPWPRYRVALVVATGYPGLRHWHGPATSPEAHAANNSAPAFAASASTASRVDSAGSAGSASAPASAPPSGGDARGAYTIRSPRPPLGRMFRLDTFAQPLLVQTEELK